MLAFTVRRRKNARAGSSLRKVIRTAVRSRIGSAEWTAPAKGATAATPSARPCSSHNPIAAFQKPRTVQGVATRKQAKRTRSTIVQPPAPTTAAIAGKRRICRDVEGEHRHAPAAQRRGRLQPGRRRVGGRRRERRGEAGVLGHPENPRSCRLSAARLKL